MPVLAKLVSCDYTSPRLAVAESCGQKQKRITPVAYCTDHRYLESKYRVRQSVENVPASDKKRKMQKPGDPRTPHQPHHQY